MLLLSILFKARARAARPPGLLLVSPTLLSTCGFDFDLARLGCFGFRQRHAQHAVSIGSRNTACVDLLTDSKLATKITHAVFVQQHRTLLIPARLDSTVHCEQPILEANID